MRVAGHWLRTSRVKLFVGEQAAASVLFLAVLATAGQGGPKALFAAMGTVLAFQAALYLGDLYEPAVEAPWERWLIAAGLGAVLVAIAWSVVGTHRPGHLLVATGLAMTVILLLRGLPLARHRRVLVYGTGAAAIRIAGAIREDTDSECRLVAFLDDDERSEGGPVPIPLITDHGEQFFEACRRADADLLVVATSAPLPEEALLRARSQGIEVLSAAGFLERWARRVAPDLAGPSELPFGEGFRDHRFSDALQRLLDLSAATFLLVLSSPLLIGGMIAVRLDSPGPIFYRQERVGRHGQRFFITKLRTMRIDAEAEGVPQWATRNDSRVTRVGRFLRLTRIDELPQIFAVLRGDMSMVGPRPERPYFVERLKEQVPLFGLREVVRPGVTGWAQISYPYGSTVEDARNKLEFDLYYVRHRSLFLNLSILFHTARTVLTGRGAR